MNQIVSQKQKIAVKYFQNEFGQIVRVYFAVIESNGRVFAKAIKSEIVSEQKIKKQEVYTLPLIKKIENIVPIVSPFFSYIPEVFKDLAFITSQPTRAPSTI